MNTYFKHIMKSYSYLQKLCAHWLPQAQQELVFSGDTGEAIHMNTAIKNKNENLVGVADLLIPN